MNMDSFSLSIDDPLFHAEAFRHLLKKKTASAAGEVEQICREEFEGLSASLEATLLQSASAARNTLRCRGLARLLIDEKGRLDREALQRAVEALERGLCSLGPGRERDMKKQEHLLRVLKLLREDKKLERALHSIGRPYMHPVADRIIRETLQLSPKTSVTDAHARQAALSAWMTRLRQTVGSCFATAPAILVQEEMPEQFLKDLRELLGTGRIKRTFRGTEYAAPLSASWGHGGLKRPFFLWEGAEEAAKKLSGSPGLIAAMEAVSLLDPEADEEEKRAVLGRKLYNAASQKAGKGGAFFTAEELIRAVLLEKLGLTEGDIQEYRERLKEMVHADLMVRAAKGGGKGTACKRFLDEFEQAKGAFKAITENALLRSWEYTIASFAEAGAGISKWNFYASLGMRHDQEGGIGERLYALLLEKLEEQKEKAEEHEKDYELVYGQVKVLEARVRRAASEQEARWVRSDYQARVNELHTIQQLRDRAMITAKRLSRLYDALVDAYLELFPRYFQEVYDAEMIEVKPDLFDDSPAGFRLVYKHGRENSAQWTKITGYREFVQALANFFTTAERELQALQEFKGLEKEIGEITTALVHHIRTKGFIESAFRRMAEVHGGKVVESPLENLEKVEKKPWVYTSGGNLNALIKNYFCREEGVTMEERWVEGPTELFAFLVDTVRKSGGEGGLRPLIMHSPVHVFLIRREEPAFASLWQSEDYSYTVIKERLVSRGQKLLDHCLLNDEAAASLLEKLSAKVPPNHRHYFLKVSKKLRGATTPPLFRQYLVDLMETEIGLQRKGEPVLPSYEIDSLLFSSLPLFPAYQLGERLEELLRSLPNLSEGSVQKALKLFGARRPTSWRKSHFDAEELQKICKALLMLATEKTAFGENYHREIRLACEKCGYCLPLAVRFADTNWEGNRFAFVVNPGTAKLEFWRVDDLNNRGEPMAAWEMWLDGSLRNPKWGIAPNPDEYFS